METSVENYVCSVCDKLQKIDLKNNHLQDELFEVKDFKLENSTYVGMPMGGSTQMLGWKIKHLQTIHTYLCSSCKEKALSNNQEKYENRKKKMKPILFGLISIFVILLFLFLFIFSSENNSQLYYGDLVIGIILLIVILIMTAIIFTKSDDSIQIIHRENREKCMKLIENSNEVVIIEPFHYGRLYPKKLNSKFFLTASDWEKISPNVKLFEEKTGWSFFHYYKTSGISSLELHSRSEIGEFNSQYYKITDYDEFRDSFEKNAVREE
jgi:hypothetical protein